jgi:PBP1b-binding outer membrane lipoprotein LpoB
MFNKLCIILISTLLLSGCSASWHLRKAVSKDPSILKPTVVTIWDTIVTPAIYLVDTVSVPGDADSSVIDNDTVRIVITKFQDKIIVKTKVKEIPYTVSVRAECPPQFVKPDSKTDKVKNYLLIFLSAALAVMMFLYRFK